MIAPRAVLFDSAEVPISKIFCVGRNYAAHAEEMSANLPPEPMIFLKPSTALARPGGGDLSIPENLGELHFEIELVLLLGGGGKNLPPAEAERLIAGYGVGLDLTLRGIQATAKERGAPWSVAKGFDGSAPVGDFVSSGDHPADSGRVLRLLVNGEQRQEGSTAEMIFSPGRIISFASRYFTLEPGDLFFTGTPSGVGPLYDGDRISASIDGLPELHFKFHR